LFVNPKNGAGKTKRKTKSRKQKSERAKRPSFIGKGCHRVGRKKKAQYSCQVVYSYDQIESAGRKRKKGKRPTKERSNGSPPEENVR